MLTWRIFTKPRLLPIDVDLITCTPNVWSSISKLISVLLEETWGSQTEEYSGLFEGYVSKDDFGFVWFDQLQSALPDPIGCNHILEDSPMALKNVLHWFYLPKTYHQCIRYYVEAKSLHLGKVPFTLTMTKNEVMTPSSASAQSTMQSNRELYLVTCDPTDLMFYCIQSLHITAESVVGKETVNNIQYFTVVGFPHHPFSCINVFGSCNVPDYQVAVHSISMFRGDAPGPNAVTGNDDPETSKLMSAFTDIIEVQESCSLMKIKEKLVVDGDMETKHETHQDPRLLEDNLPALRTSQRGGRYCVGKGKVNVKSIMRISCKYAKLASAKDQKVSNCWGGSRGHLQPKFIIDCPGCARIYPPSPNYLYNMLCHLRSRHKEHFDELLSSISGTLESAVTFMQKRIMVWNKIRRKQM